VADWGSVAAPGRIVPRACHSYLEGRLTNPRPTRHCQSGLSCVGSVTSASAPSRPRPPLRIRTGGGALQLGSRPTFGAVISAPAPAVTCDNGIELYISLFAARFGSENDATFHYDRGILVSGASCGAAPLPPVD
jgi:hypothetical protein